MDINTLMLIIFILLGCGFYIYLVRKKYITEGSKAAEDMVKRDLRETVFQLFFIAQKIYGRDADVKKFKFVVGEIYKYVPFEIIKQVLKEETLEEYVEKLYKSCRHKLLDFLDNGAVDESYKEELTITKDESEVPNTHLLTDEEKDSLLTDDNELPTELEETSENV